MNRIERLLKKLNAKTGANFTCIKWARGDWDLYRNDEHEINALNADAMIDYIRRILASA